jgi:hypothetical protein
LKKKNLLEIQVWIKWHLLTQDWFRCMCCMKRLFFHYSPPPNWFNLLLKRRKYVDLVFSVVPSLKINGNTKQQRRRRRRRRDSEQSFSQMIEYGRMYVSNCRHFDICWFETLTKRSALSASKVRAGETKKKAKEEKNIGMMWSVWYLHY